MTLTDWTRLLILSILWGGSFFFVELALQGLPVLTIVWCRVALAALVLGLVLRASGLPFPPRAQMPAMLVMGLINNALPFCLFVLAQGQITGALAAVLNATTPLFTVVVAHFATSDERLTGAKALGLLLGFAGVIGMMAGGGLAGSYGAALMCLAAALSYGCAGVWGRRFRLRGVAPLTTAFGQVAASTLLLAPLWLWQDMPWQMGWPGLVPVLAVAGLAVLSTALAYLLYFQLLASAGATNLALVTFLIPISATALGALLGERLDAAHWAGFGLIVLGLLAIDGRLLQRRRAG